MKVTIVPNDKVVCVDGVCYNTFDMSGVPIDVHALQWLDVAGQTQLKNWDNIDITELPQWALDLVSAWETYNESQINPPPPTPEQIQINNSAEAEELLSQSDWAVLPDVQLANQSEWIAYRQQVREIRVDPPSTPAVFPPTPPVIWATPNP